MDPTPTTTAAREFRPACQFCHTVWQVRDVDVLQPNGTVARQHLCTDCCRGRVVVMDRGRAAWRY